MAAFREALQQRLDPATWHVGGGEGSLVATYRPSAALSKATGLTPGLTSAIRVDVAMDRPRRERTRRAGGHRQPPAPGRSGQPQAPRARGPRPARPLVPPLRPRRTRYDCGGLRAARLRVVSLAHDTEARVAGLEGDLAATAERVRDLGDVLSAWTPVFRAAVADPHAVVR